MRGLCAAVTVLLLTGCGGPGFEQPTAIPPDIVRPVQPEPTYAGDVHVFSTRTPPPPRFPPEFTGAPVSDAPHGWSTVVPPMEQPPSALGIVRGAGAAVRLTVDGPTVASLPAGSTITVTGRSADGQVLTFFSDAGLVGWVAAASVILFGADDLDVVATAVNPGPVATLLSKAMEPMTSSVLTATRTVATPSASVLPPFN